MKALSLKQPWEELVIQGRKTIEIRKWNTKFKGKFFVHASGNIYEKKMKEFNFKELPRQKIVGEVELVDVKKYDNKKEFLIDKDKHLVFSMKWEVMGLY